MSNDLISPLPLELDSKRKSFTFGHFHKRTDKGNNRKFDIRMQPTEMDNCASLCEQNRVKQNL